MEHSNDSKSGGISKDNPANQVGSFRGGSVSAALNDLSRKAVTPASAITIQQTLGNQFLLRQMGLGRKTIQRLFQTKTAWKTTSKKPKIRSTELQAIDTAIGEYEPLNNSDDYGAREAGLANIEAKIQLWKDSKDDWTTTQRKNAITGLELDIQNERAEVNRLKKNAEVAAQRDAKLAEIIPDAVKNLPDTAARATAVFDLFMGYFRGKITYSLRTTGSVYGGGGEVACATIATGLRDAFRYVGLTSETKKLTSLRFITKPITDAFMDTAATGNVKTPDKDYSEVKRYLFSEHWVTEVNGAQYFDPTSGITLSSLAGPELVDPKYANLIQGKNQYTKDAITVQVLLNEPIGTGYLLQEA